MSAPGHHTAFSADGFTARWARWDGAGEEQLSLQWENEAWTASGVVGAERVQYVVRVSPTWQVRQFLLFRDLPEPDLWLATDGHARWGEMNGAHRPELDGCHDVDLTCTPFTNTLPIRRLPIEVGDAAELAAVAIDVDTLAVVPHVQRYERLDERAWRFTDVTAGDASTFEVDEYGVVVDQPGRFRRTSAH
jgi:hypothetical protein